MGFLLGISRWFSWLKWDVFWKFMGSSWDFVRVQWWFPWWFFHGDFRGIWFSDVQMDIWHDFTNKHGGMAHLVGRHTVEVPRGSHWGRVVGGGKTTSAKYGSLVCQTGSLCHVIWNVESYRNTMINMKRWSICWSRCVGFLSPHNYCKRNTQHALT